MVLHGSMAEESWVYARGSSRQYEQVPIQDLCDGGISFNLGLLQTFLIIHMYVYITVETISHRPMPLEYSYFFYVL